MPGAKARFSAVMTTMLAAAACIAAARPGGPPPARVAPVVDDYYGTQVTDPYRWMETPDNAELRDWMKAQTAYTRARIDRLPGRGPLLERIRQLDRTTSQVYGIVPVGERFFYFRRKPDEPVPKVYVRDGIDGKERVLIDPTAHASKKDGHAEVGWIEPSKDGRYLAYGIALGGGEWGELHVIAVDSGKTLGEKINRVWAGSDASSASWLPDNGTFAYLRFPQLAPGQPPQEKQLRSRVYVHTLGRNPSGDGDTAIFGFGVHDDIKVPEEAFSFVTALPGASYAVANMQNVGVDYIGVYVAPLAALSGPAPIAWKRVVGPDDQISSTARLVAHGNDLYFLTHRDAPRFAVVRFDMGSTDVSHATVVVPESKVVIEDIAAAQDGLYIQELDGSVSRLRRLSWSGTNPASVVGLPFSGAIAHTSTSPGFTGALLRLRSWNHPNEIVHVNPQAHTARNTGWQEAPAVDFSKIDALEVNAASYDGTLVPLSILVGKDAKRDGSHPTLLDSYGAYGVYGTALPYFDARSLAWLERGGVLAFCHPRGGGEFGEEWHRAGMKETKLNTVFDTIACAQHLIDERYTTPKNLAVSGASAGGIAVGGAITWRPYMFAAAIDHAGVTDTLRFETTANGPDNVAEFGSVKTLEGFRALHAASPYTNVKHGVSYPAVLLEAGANDPRVESWVVAKMAARLQAATASKRPILLRVDFDTGHFGGTTDQEAQLLVDEWSFLLWQFGDPAFQPKPLSSDAGSTQ
jgi:prolyl oligopeptidase